MDRIYEFGPFRLDCRSGMLWRGNQAIHLTAKGYSTLELLIERAGLLVSKDELLATVWPEGFIEPANVTQTIYVLRKTLCNANGDTYIETVPGRGYRFAAPVHVAEASTELALSREPYSRGIRFLRRVLLWPAVAIVLVLASLTLHSSAPSGANRLQVSAAAQRDYVLGRHYWSERTPARLQLGLHYFRSALKKAPFFAQAYSGIADSYTALGYYGSSYTARKRDYRLAEAAAKRGIQIDPTAAEPHASLAFVYQQDGPSRWQDSAAEFEQSIALDPNYATAREWYSWLLYSKGRRQEGLAQMLRARDLDPTSPVINYALGYQLFFMRHFQDAADQWHQTIALMPYQDQSYLGAGLADEQLGRTIVAMTEFQHALRLSPGDPDILAALAHVYVALKRPADAKRLLGRVAQLKPVSAYNIAVIKEALGRRDEACKWLQVARVTHDSNLWTLPMDPRMDELRRHYNEYKSARNSS